jgi:hypothetical protein
MPLKIAKIVSEVNCVLRYNALISDFYNFGELLPHGSYWRVECRIRGIGTFLPTQLQQKCGRDCCSYLVVAPETFEKKTGSQAHAPIEKKAGSEAPTNIVESKKKQKTLTNKKRLESISMMSH